jgi:hypothetical protein
MLDTNKTTSTNDEEALRSLGTRRDGGREGEVVLHVRGSAMATDGVLRHVHPLGNSTRRSVANSGARVPKVLSTAELEGDFAGLIIAVLLEPFGSAAVSNDVEEPQESPGSRPLVEMTQGRKAS